MIPRCETASSAMNCSFRINYVPLRLKYLRLTEGHFKMQLCQFTGQVGVITSGLRARSATGPVSVEAGHGIRGGPLFWSWPLWSENNEVVDRG